MKYSLQVLDAAEADLQEALAWYERIDPDIATFFKARVKETVDKILRNPFIYAAQGNHVRRVSLEQFSYNIFFTVQDTVIIIIALFHGRRSPAAWQSRLS